MIIHIQTSNAQDLEAVVYQLLEHNIDFVYGRPDCKDDSVYPTDTLAKWIGLPSLPFNIYVKSDDEDLLVWLKLKI